MKAKSNSRSECSEGSQGGNHRRKAADLLAAAYGQLRRQAELAIRRERAGHTLSATALVHEAYLRVVGSSGNNSFDGKPQFYAAALEAMNRVLIDHARARNAQKRAGNRKPLSDLGELAQTAAETTITEILALEDALLRLEEQDADAAAVVRLRFFEGLSVEEAAKALNVSPRTVKREWQVARAWLYEQMRTADGRTE